MHAQLAVHLSEGFEKIPSAPLNIGEWGILAVFALWGALQLFTLAFDSKGKA